MGLKAIAIGTIINLFYNVIGFGLLMSSGIPNGSRLAMGWIEEFDRVEGIGGLKPNGFSVHAVIRVLLSLAIIYPAVLYYQWW